MSIDINDFRKDFSPQALRVGEHATLECMRMMHPHVGEEHVLLGLLMEPDGEASKLLVKQGIPASRVRLEVMKMYTDRTYVTLDPKLSRSANHALYLAWQYVMLFGGMVETEHILLALWKKDGNRDAVQLLQRLRVDLGRLEADLMTLLESRQSGIEFARFLRQPDKEIGESDV